MRSVRSDRQISVTRKNTRQKWYVVIPRQLQLFAINYLRFDDVQSCDSILQTVKRDDAYLEDAYLASSFRGAWRQQ